MTSSHAANDQDTVYVIPIEASVEKGLYSFLKRAINIAEENDAKAIIFDIHTPGGAVDAATDIANLLSSTEIKKIAFVNSWALSAGAYISLFADEIYMVPNGKIGAAAVINQEGETAGKKAESAWRAEMESAAKIHGRDPKIAAKMVNKDDPLTLTSYQAEDVGYAEGTVKNLEELLDELGFADVEVKKVDETFAEKLARFITNPIVVPILLSIGSLGLVVELYSPGFGLPGIMGISSLLLFFYGHLVAGLAGYESIVLFVLGIILIAAELFVPGGILGILGGLALVGSILMAGENVLHTSISLIIALFLAILLMIILVKVFGKRMKFFKKLILSDSTNTESGYISNVNRIDLIGLEGKTLTQLRPSGTMKIGDERIDVVSEGAFIEKDACVKVIKVEGSRVVVRKIDQKGKD